MNGKLIIVRGCPGSGKSTFSSHMFGNSLRLENDMFHYRCGKYEFSQRKQDMAIQWCTDSCILAMSRGMDVCLSNTYTKRRYVDYCMNIAKTFGYDVEIYRMTGKFQNIHGLSEEMVAKFSTAMEDIEGETYVYPVPGQDFEYRFCKIKVGDRVTDKYGLDGTVTKVECLGCGDIRISYNTEGNLFFSAGERYCSEKDLTRK